MYFTRNDTSHGYGCAEATVICDSISPAGVRITTMELMYPRFIHGQLLTHRAFSRGSASSRATPTRVLLDEVRKHPVTPTVWRRNQRGMSGGEELPDAEAALAEVEWLAACEYAASAAERIANMGVAKETVRSMCSRRCSTSQKPCKRRRFRASPSSAAITCPM